MPASRKTNWKSRKLRFLFVVCQMFVGGLVVCVSLYCLILTHTWPNSSLLNFKYSVCLAFYICINLFVNWFQFKWKLNVGRKGTERGSQAASSSFSSCVDPYGAYHCPICEACIWRRDHHCFFLGGCVGLCNLNNFVSFCFNACLGSVYATLLLTHHLSTEFKDFFSFDFKYYVLPFTLAQWLNGRVAAHHLIGVLLLNVVFTVFISTTFMLSLQAYMIFVSKTSYELFRGGNAAPARQHGSWRNFERALGTHWFVALFVPDFSLVGRRKSGGGTWNEGWEPTKYV